MFSNLKPMIEENLVDVIKFKRIGYTYSLMETMNHNGLPHRLIEQSIIQNTSRFYFNIDGHLRGYVMWALLDLETENKIAQSMDVTSLHRCELREGKFLWITDACILPGSAWEILRDIKQLFPNHHELKYIRKSRVHSIIW